MAFRRRHVTKRRLPITDDVLNPLVNSTPAAADHNTVFYDNVVVVDDDAADVVDGGNDDDHKNHVCRGASSQFRWKRRRRWRRSQWRERQQRILRFPTAAATTSLPAASLSISGSFKNQFRDHGRIGVISIDEVDVYDERHHGLIPSHGQKENKQNEDFGFSAEFPAQSQKRRWWS